MIKLRESLFWQNYDKFEKIVDNSPMRSTIDALIMWKLFQEYQFENVLEIGVYQGQTAGLILDSCSDLKSYTGIDISLKLDLFYKIWGQHTNKTKFYQQPSSTFDYNQTYDFILVDGDHSELGVLQDLSKVEPCLSKNGILAIDDFDIPSVSAAVDTWSKRTPLVPFLQVQQTEFWHYPVNDRSKFLDGLFTDPISNFVFLYNINNDKILKAKTSRVFTNNLGFFNQMLEFYDI